MGTSSAPPEPIFSHCRYEISQRLEPDPPAGEELGERAGDVALRLGDLDVLDRAGRFEVAKVGVERRRALGLDEQGAVRALEARQVADVDRVRDEERLGEAGGEAGEAGHHCLLSFRRPRASR